MTERRLDIVPRDTEINKDAVKLLRDVLKEAEGGQVIEVAIVYTTLDGGTVTATTPTKSTKNLIGALEIMKYDLIKRLPTGK